MKISTCKKSNEKHEHIIISFVSLIHLMIDNIKYFIQKNVKTAHMEKDIFKNYVHIHKYM